MTKQLEDIVRRVSAMPTEELLALVGDIRKNKYQTRPAKKQRTKKKSKVGLKALLKGMSKEQIQALLKESKNGGI